MSGAIIYRDDFDRGCFLNLLARTIVDRRWLLHAWVLMANHYRLLIETPEVGLPSWNEVAQSGVCRALQRASPQSRSSRSGSLQRHSGRAEGHLLELIRYIVLNPVRCHAVTFAGDYEWSNYRATAGLQTAPPWLEIGWTLDQFGPDRATAHEAYRRFVAGARGASYNPWESLIGQMYLGGAEFCDRMQSDAIACCGEAAQPRASSGSAQVRPPHSRRHHRHGR
jgi:hypothetical protein